MSSVTPDINEVIKRPVTVADVYYVLERWATLMVWNSADLTPPGHPTLITLPDASPHYAVYDRGSCLVAAPKDLFSHERTTRDALDTAQAMASEVYRREWAIEFAGFDKMQRALWVKLQHLEDEYGRKVEISHYQPSFQDLRIYMAEAKQLALKRLDMQNKK